MSTDKYVQLGGADGIVDSLSATAYCPAGKAVWELTVDDSAKKCDEDFDKRTKKTPPESDAYSR